MLRTDLLMFGVAGTVFGITGEMCQLPANFDNPVSLPQDQTHFRLCQANIKVTVS